MSTIWLLGASLACGDNLAGAPDAAGTPPADARTAEPDASRSRERLSEVGLYADLATEELAPGVRAFAPRHELWTDGAVKRRWIALPPDAVVDASDLDHWQLPVGTKLFKEFVRDGVRVETRMIERTGPGARDYWMGAFVWRADGSDADFAPDGEENARGTEHDVPDADRCWTCHTGEPGRALGFSALQLAGSAGPLDLEALIDEGRIEPIPAGAIELPGDAVAQAALGTLHASCGHCHNETGSAWPDVDLVLRVETGAASVEDTALYASTVGVELARWNETELLWRIAAGDADASGVVARMETRIERDQMPPIGTELVDDAGVAAVRAWIDGLAE